MHIAGCLLFLVGLPASLSMRTANPECEGLRSAQRQLQEKDRIIAQLRQALHAAKRKIEELSDRNASSSWQDTTEVDLGCCCRAGRCEANEIGTNGARGQEVGGRCCKSLVPGGPGCGVGKRMKSMESPDRRMCQGSAWQIEHGELCHSSKEQKLDDFAAGVSPNTLQTSQMSPEERAVAKARCAKEIASFYQGVESWSIREETFHGHWIRTVHAKHLAEETCYQLFIDGMPFGVGSGAVRLFTLPQPVKMLWSGTPPAIRDQWKQKEMAGELAKDTSFGQIVEQETVNRLSSCDFAALRTFWEASSSSLLNIDQEKPVLILINKTKEQITDTTFWRAELPSLAQYPPKAALRLVTWQMPCIDLIALLEDRIQEVVGPSVGTQLRWTKNMAHITCEDRGALSSPPTAYPPPFSTADQLVKNGFTAKVLKGLRFSASWLKGRGFAVGEMKAIGFSIEEMKRVGYSAAEARDGGYSAAEMRRAGYSANEMRDVGRSAEEMKHAGYKPQEMRSAGYSLKEMRYAGYSAKQMFDLGVFAAGVRAAGYSAKEMRAAGYLAHEMSYAGYSAKKLKDAGYLAQEMKDAGYLVQEMKDAGYSGEEMKDVGYPASDLRLAGYSAQEMKDAGYWASEMKQAGYLAREMWDAGYSARQMGHAGFSAAELREVGYSMEELSEARFSAKAMKDAGYSAEEMQRFRQYTATAMRDAGYSTKELWKAGYAMWQLVLDP